jgi:hypothetical protein
MVRGFAKSGALAIVVFGIALVMTGLGAQTRAAPA